MNYIDIELSDMDTKGVSNVDVYAVCYKENQSNLVAVQEFVFNEKDKPSTKYSIVKRIDNAMTLLQRYTPDGNLENVTDTANHNHVYLVSLIGGETNALNETMKHTIKV